MSNQCKENELGSNMCAELGSKQREEVLSNLCTYKELVKLTNSGESGILLKEALFGDKIFERIVTFPCAHSCNLVLGVESFLQLRLVL